MRAKSWGSRFLNVIKNYLEKNNVVLRSPSDVGAHEDVRASGAAGAGSAAPTRKPVTEKKRRAATPKQKPVARKRSRADEAGEAEVNFYDDGEGEGDDDAGGDDDGGDYRHSAAAAAASSASHRRPTSAPSAAATTSSGVRAMVPTASSSNLEQFRRK